MLHLAQCLQAFLDRRVQFLIFAVFPALPKLLAFPLQGSAGLMDARQRFGDVFDRFRERFLTCTDTAH